MDVDAGAIIGDCYGTSVDACAIYGDVAVYVKATHFCVKCRGIKDANSYTVTSAFGGVFLEDRETRKEFLSLINK